MMPREITGILPVGSSPVFGTVVLVEGHGGIPPHEAGASEFGVELPLGE